MKDSGSIIIWLWNGQRALCNQHGRCLFKWHGWSAVTAVASASPCPPFSNSLHRSPFLHYSSKSDQRGLSSVERVKDRSEGRKKKPWIFHRNHFIKILLQWNFASREALTTGSLYVVSRQILARASDRHVPWPEIPQSQNIFMHSRLCGPNGGLLSIKREYISATSMRRC